MTDFEDEPNLGVDGAGLPGEDSAVQFVAGSAPPSRRGRLVSAGTVTIEPLYPSSKLLKSALFQADELQAEAAQRVEQARRQAEHILGEARRAAEQIVEAARREEALIRQTAAREGALKASEDWTALIHGFNEAVEEYTRRLPEWVRDTSYRLARHILEVEFTVRPDRVLEFVDRALAKARRQKAITIHLHPDDYAIVEPLRLKLQEKHGLEEAPRVIESDEVPRHSVRVETGVSRAAYEIGIDELFEELRRQVERKLK